MRTFLLAVVFLAIGSLSASADETPGISATKPESGPFVKIESGYMVPYEISIPGSDATLKMIPIPGGTVKLGSPAAEAGHTTAEGPEVEVKVEPFWMAETETTWGQYLAFMAMYDIFKKFDKEKVRAVTDKNRVDAVTIPTPLHDPGFTFEHGEDDELPAVTMTNYAARQFTKWISGVKGQQYRLPSEAEWEWAASGGAASAYHFGDDAGKLTEYGWFVDNADEHPHFVKQKKPNQFGLYDMHGNVWEWVLDQYDESGYELLKGKQVSGLESVKWPTKRAGMMLKGGGWDDEAEACRLASKLSSEEDNWKESDPNRASLSPWWFTDYPTTCIGFRVLRPLKEMPKREALVKFYDPNIEDLIFFVGERLIEGRAALGVADQELPAAIQQAD